MEAVFLRQLETSIRRDRALPTASRPTTASGMRGRATAPAARPQSAAPRARGAPPAGMFDTSTGDMKADEQRRREAAESAFQEWLRMKQRAGRAALRATTPDPAETEQQRDARREQSRAAFEEWAKAKRRQELQEQREKQAEDARIKADVEKFLARRAKAAVVTSLSPTRPYSAGATRRSTGQRSAAASPAPSKKKPAKGKRRGKPSYAFAIAMANIENSPLAKPMDRYTRPTRAPWDPPPTRRTSRGKRQTKSTGVLPRRRPLPPLKHHASNTGQEPTGLVVLQEKEAGKSKAGSHGDMSRSLPPMASEPPSSRRSSFGASSAVLGGDLRRESSGAASLSSVDPSVNGDRAHGAAIPDPVGPCSVAPAAAGGAMVEAGQEEAGGVRPAPTPAEAPAPPVPSTPDDNASAPSTLPPNMETSEQAAIGTSTPSAVASTPSAVASTPSAVALPKAGGAEAIETSTPAASASTPSAVALPKAGGAEAMETSAPAAAASTPAAVAPPKAGGAEAIATSAPAAAALPMPMAPSSPEAKDGSRANPPGSTPAAARGTPSPAFEGVTSSAAAPDRGSTPPLCDPPLRATAGAEGRRRVSSDLRKVLSEEAIVKGPGRKTRKEKLKGKGDANSKSCSVQ